MSNSYYTKTTDVIPGARSKDTDIDTPLEAIEDGFDKLPDPHETKKGFSGAVPVGDATAQDEAPNVEQLLSGGVDEGTDASTELNTYLITMPVTVTSYTKLSKVWFRAAMTNTDACTINIDGLGEKYLRRIGGAELAPGDIAVGELIGAAYTGSEFRIFAGVPNLAITAGEDTITTIISQVYPDQTGQSGKVLTTNGANTSWLALTVPCEDYQEFTVSGTWTKPAEAKFVYVEAISGGGGGANNTGGVYWGGGSGGEFVSKLFEASTLGSTVEVTIGAGGSGGASGASEGGSNGGNSSFGAHLVAIGGKGCISGSVALTAIPRAAQAAISSTFEILLATVSPQAGYGGTSTYAGGNTIYGGAGGGGANNAIGGSSQYGGAGGAGVATASTKGGDGSSPGGGGGGSANDGGGGDGGNGIVRVWAW